MPGLRLALAGLLLATFALSVPADALPHRTYAFCDTSSGVQCGVTYKEADRHCPVLTTDRNGNSIHLCRGSGGEIGVGIDHQDQTPALCGNTPENCYGANAGQWSCSYGTCYAVVELPGPNGNDVAVYGSGSSVCIKPGGRTPICVP